MIERNADGLRVFLYHLALTLALTHGATTASFEGSRGFLPVVSAKGWCWSLLTIDESGLVVAGSDWGGGSISYYMSHGVAAVTTRVSKLHDAS